MVKQTWTGSSVFGNITRPARWRKKKKKKNLWGTSHALTVYVGAAWQYFCIRSALFFSFFCDILPSPLLFPFFSPLAWSWLPGSWGLAKACVPGGAREEMERGGSKGLRSRLQNHSCSSLSSPLLSSPLMPPLPCLALSPALPLIRGEGYFSACVFVCEGERCWLCEWLTECLCVSPRVLIESWMGRHRWYGDQDLTTKLESSPREQKGEGGLVSRLGLPATGRKRQSDDLQKLLASQAQNPSDWDPSDVFFFFERKVLRGTCAQTCKLHEQFMTRRVNRSHQGSLSR